MSTCPDAIDFEALCGTNVVTLPPCMWEPRRVSFVCGRPPRLAFKIWSSVFGFWGAVFLQEQPRSLLGRYGLTPTILFYRLKSTKSTAVHLLESGIFIVMGPFVLKGILRGCPTTGVWTASPSSAGAPRACQVVSQRAGMSVEHYTAYTIRIYCIYVYTVYTYVQYI